MIVWIVGNQTMLIGSPGRGNNMKRLWNGLLIFLMAMLYSCTVSVGTINLSQGEDTGPDIDTEQTNAPETDVKTEAEVPVSMIP